MRGISSKHTRRRTGILWSSFEVRTLRSSTGALLVIPFVRSDFASDAFSVSSPPSGTISLRMFDHAEGDLPEDREEAWSITRDTILTTGAENIPVKRAVRCPWLTTETMDIIDQKKEAECDSSKPF